jgi:hypothetical protein
MKYTEDELKALQESLQHWEENLRIAKNHIGHGISYRPYVAVVVEGSGEEITFRSQDCSCCQLNKCIKSKEDSEDDYPECRFCPLFKFYQYACDESTPVDGPWQRVRTALRDATFVHQITEDMVAMITAMRDWIKVALDAAE